MLGPASLLPTHTDKYVLVGQTPVPCPDLLVWARWFEENGEARRVKSSSVLGLCVVSTVFLGLDHGWGRGRPVLFETMAFWGEHGYEQERCSTWSEAEEQHEAMCREVARPAAVWAFVRRRLAEVVSSARSDWRMQWKRFRGIPLSEIEALMDRMDRMRDRLGDDD